MADSAIPPDGSSDESLPIVKHRNVILQHIYHHKISLIQGDPGCGKSSMVPQFLISAHQSHKVIITQPTNLSATRLAALIRQQRHIDGEVVTVWVEDGQVPKEARIVVCTTACLLRKLAIQPATLKSFTHAIIDEAHDRSTNADLLLMLLKLMLPFADGIRLIFMSATLNAPLLQHYYADEGPVSPPLWVGSSPHGVTCIYLNELPTIHPRLKQGAHEALLNHTPHHAAFLPAMRHLLLDLIRLMASPGLAILVFLPGTPEIQSVRAALLDMFVVSTTLNIIIVGTNEVAFDGIADKRCHVLLADSSAMSSLTLPDVHHVIDTGLCRAAAVGHTIGHTVFRLQWISRAAAAQRAGRVGRLAPGTAIRLYTRKTYDVLRAHDKAELRCIALPQTILMTHLLLHHMGVAQNLLAHAPNPPAPSRLKDAIELLVSEGAIHQAEEGMEVTNLGRVVAYLPLDVRLARIVLFGHAFGCLPQALVMACALTLPQLLVKPDNTPAKDTPSITAQVAQYADWYQAGGGQLSDPLISLMVYVRWLQRKPSIISPPQAKALDCILCQAIDTMLTADVLPLSPKTKSQLETLRQLPHNAGSSQKAIVEDLLGPKNISLLQLLLGMAAAPNFLHGMPAIPLDVLQIAKDQMFDIQRTVLLTGIPSVIQTADKFVQALNLPEYTPSQATFLLPTEEGTKLSALVELADISVGHLSLGPHLLRHTFMAENRTLPILPTAGLAEDTLPSDIAWSNGAMALDDVRPLTSLQWCLAQQDAERIVLPLGSNLVPVSQYSEEERYGSSVAPVIAAISVKRKVNEEAVASGLTLLHPLIAALAQLIMTPICRKVLTCLSGGQHYIAQAEVVQCKSRVRLSFELQPLEPVQWDLVNKVRVQIGIVLGTQPCGDASMEHLVVPLVQDISVDTVKSPQDNRLPAAPSSLEKTATEDVTSLATTEPQQACNTSSRRRPDRVSGLEAEDRWAGWRWHTIRPTHPWDYPVAAPFPHFSIGLAIKVPPTQQQSYEWQVRRYKAAMYAEYMNLRKKVVAALDAQPAGLQSTDFQKYDGFLGRTARQRRQLLGYRRLRELLSSMPDLVEIVVDVDDASGWRARRPLPQIPGEPPRRPSRPPILLPPELRPSISLLLLPSGSPAFIKQFLTPPAVPWNDPTPPRLPPGTLEPPTVQQLSAPGYADYHIMKDVVDAIMEEFPEGTPIEFVARSKGLRGTAAKLRREIFGYERFPEFLASMPDVVTLVYDTRWGWVVFPAHISAEEAKKRAASWPLNYPTTSSLGPAYAIFKPPHLRRSEKIITPDEFLLKHGTPVDRNTWNLTQWRDYNSLRRYVKRHIREYSDGIRAISFGHLPELGGNKNAKRVYKKLGYHSLWALLLSMPDIVMLEMDGEEMDMWKLHPASPMPLSASLPIPDHVKLRPTITDKPIIEDKLFPPEYQHLADFPVPYFAVTPASPWMVSQGKVNRLIDRLKPEYPAFRAIVKEAVSRAKPGSLLAEFANATGLAWVAFSRWRRGRFKVRLVRLLQGMPDLIYLERDRFSSVDFRVFRLVDGKVQRYPPSTPFDPTALGLGVPGCKPYGTTEDEDWTDDDWDQPLWPAPDPLLQPAYTLEETDPALHELEAEVLPPFAPLPALSFFWNGAKVRAYTYFRRLIQRYIQRFPQGVTADVFWNLPGMDTKKPRRRRQQMGYRTPWDMLQTMPEIVTVDESASHMPEFWVLYPTKLIDGIGSLPPLERPPWEWINRPRVLAFGPMWEPPVAAWELPEHLEEEPAEEPAMLHDVNGKSGSIGHSKDLTSDALSASPQSTDGQPLPRDILHNAHQPPMYEQGDVVRLEDSTVPQNQVPAIAAAVDPTEAMEENVRQKLRKVIIPRKLPPKRPLVTAEELEPPVPIPSHLQGHLADEYRMLYEMVKDAIDLYPDGAPLRPFCLKIGLASLENVARRKALGYAKLLDLLKTMPAIVTLAADPDQPGHYFVFPPYPIMKPFTRNIKPLRKIQCQLIQNPYYARFQEKLVRRIAEIYPNGIPEAAARPKPRPLAPGETRLEISGFEEVQNLYKLYITTAAERRMFPKEKQNPVVDMDTLLAAIRKEIQKYPNGVDMSKFCVLSKFKTAPVRDIYSLLGFSSFAEFLKSRPELVEVQFGVGPRQYTLFPSRVVTPDRDPWDIFMEHRQAAKDAELTAETTVPLGPDAIEQQPNADQVLDYLGLKRMAAAYLRGVPDGMVHTRFCKQSGLYDQRIKGVRNALGYSYWVHFFESIPDVLQMTRFEGRKPKVLIHMPISEVPAPTPEFPYEPLVTVYDRFLARMMVHLAQRPDPFVIPFLPPLAQTDAGIRAACLAFRDLALEVVRQHPEGIDYQAFCNMLHLYDRPFITWRQVADCRHWNQMFGYMSDVFAIERNREMLHRFEVLPIYPSAFQDPPPNEPLTLLASHTETLGAPLPSSLEFEAAALRRMVARYLRHYPLGADLTDFCFTTGLSDDRLVAKWHALGYERLTDWLGSLTDLLELRPKPDDPRNYDIFPFGVPLITQGLDVPQLFNDTISQQMEKATHLPDKAKQQQLIAAEYQAFRSIVAEVIKRHPLGLEMDAFSEECHLDDEDLTIARRQVGYSRPIDLLRSMPDIVRLQRYDDSSSAWAVFPAHELPKVISLSGTSQLSNLNSMVHSSQHPSADSLSSLAKAEEPPALHPTQQAPKLLALHGADGTSLHCGCSCHYHSNTHHTSTSLTTPMLTPSSNLYPIPKAAASSCIIS